MKHGVGPDQRPRPLIIYVAFAVLCAIWGSTWLVIREGLRDLPPLTSAGARFAVAAAIMLFLAPMLARREGGEQPPRWLWVASGLFNFTFPYAVVYWCEQTLPSGLVSLLWAVFPMLMAASGHLFLPGERLRGWQWMGFLVGFVGVGFLFRTDLAGLSAGAVGTGALLMLSPLCSCVGNTLVKRYGGSVSSALLNKKGMALAAVLLVGAAWLTEGSASIDWSARALFSVGYLSLLGTVATFGLFFWILRYAPAHLLSLIAFITPTIALSLGWLVADEPITANTLVGALLIVGGIGLVVGRRLVPHPAAQAEAKG